MGRDERQKTGDARPQRTSERLERQVREATEEETTRRIFGTHRPYARKLRTPQGDTAVPASPIEAPAFHGNGSFSVDYAAPRGAADNGETHAAASFDRGAKFYSKNGMGVSKKRGDFQVMAGDKTLSGHVLAGSLVPELKSGLKCSLVALVSGTNLRSIRKKIEIRSPFFPSCRCYLVKRKSLLKS